MAFTSPSDEGEGPVLQSQAEITLKKLLDKQLDTNARLEQVEFEHARESMRSIGHGFCGVSTLAEFVKNELAQKQLLEKARLVQNVLHGMGYSIKEVQERCQKISCSGNSTSTNLDKGIKRKRYGADPLFVHHSEAEELKIAMAEAEHRLEEERNNLVCPESLGRHSKELEASILKGKERLQGIAHLSGGGSACRKPLFDEAQRIGQVCMTPQDRARQSAEKERLADEVFASSAPEVLDLHTYMSQRCKDEVVTSVGAPEGGELDAPSHSQERKDQVLEIPEQEILGNRLSEDEIRNLSCKKFTNYSPGNPSHVLYIKNLAKDVTEADLVALFARYQTTGEMLMFRLMKRGRMKGQAFVTFPDERRSMEALKLINGYKLKGRPMVIEFGHGNPGTSGTSCE